MAMHCVSFPLPRPRCYQCLSRWLLPRLDHWGSGRLDVPAHNGERRRPSRLRSQPARRHDSENGTSNRSYAKPDSYFRRFTVLCHSTRPEATISLIFSTNPLTYGLQCQAGSSPKWCQRRHSKNRQVRSSVRIRNPQLVVKVPVCDLRAPLERAPVFESIERVCKSPDLRPIGVRGRQVVEPEEVVWDRLHELKGFIGHWIWEGIISCIQLFPNMILTPLPVSPQIFDECCFHLLQCQVALNLVLLPCDPIYVLQCPRLRATPLNEIPEFFDKRIIGRHTIRGSPLAAGLDGKHHAKAKGEQTYRLCCRQRLAR